MNFYKRGDAARAEDIKAAFEKLNTHSISGYDFSRGDVLFFSFTGKEGVKYMMSTNMDSWLADMITTHPDYKELRLPKERHPKFKVGDLVLFRDMLGRIKDVPEDEEGPQLYMVGDGLYAEECELRLADHRDEVRILKGGNHD